MAVPASVVTDTELSVLRMLWDQQPLSARMITQRLYEEVNPSSIGTVQKLLSRLEKKSLVHRDRGQSPHQFSPAVTREDVAGMKLDEFAGKLSAGSLSPFVMHLVQSKRLTKQEKARIRRLLEES